MILLSNVEIELLLEPILDVFLISKSKVNPCTHTLICKDNSVMNRIFGESMVKGARIFKIPVIQMYTWFLGSLTPMRMYMSFLTNIWHQY